MRRLLTFALLSACSAPQPCVPQGSPHERTRAGVQRQRSFSLIHPLLDVDYPIAFHELKPFRDKITAFIEGQVANKKAAEVSVYFRDLNNGYWTGIDERREFSPASLLKVPLMMTVMRESEADPGLLGRIVTYDAASADAFRSSGDVPQQDPITVGQSYSVAELVRRMLANSDNGAAVAITGVVAREALEKTYSDLGLKLSLDPAAPGALSVKQYATFFRILYNASYLSKSASQKALEMLASSSFKRGLVAGVPEGVAVAHKFGERQVDGASLLQFHDCGIVYHPKEHYLLCVMTRGGRTEELQEVISGVSRLVFDEVDSQLPTVQAP